MRPVAIVVVDELGQYCSAISTSNRVANPCGATAGPSQAAPYQGAAANLQARGGEARPRRLDPAHKPGKRVGAQRDLELMAEGQVLERDIPARSNGAARVRRTRSSSSSIRQDSNLPLRAELHELDRLLPLFSPTA